MLVFHGTGGKRDLVDKICVRGAAAAQARPGGTTRPGFESHVFVCTTPVGTRGGDPIHFAQQRAWTDRRAWLFVRDVPPSLVRGAVPNSELEQYWNVHTSLEQRVFSPTLGICVARSATCASRVDLRASLLDYVVVSTAPDLCEAPADAHTLIQFEHAYLRARTRAAKQRVAASYGLRVPDDYANDSHSPWCAACMGQLFHLVIALADDDARQFSRGAFHRLDLVTFGALADAFERWLTACGDPLRYTTFASFQREHPPPRDLVPRTMWPDFATADLDARMRLPDTQLLLDHVPPEYIVGAIDVGDDDRLSPVVRPRDGEILIDKLWYLSRQLVERRRRSSVPIIVD